VTKAPQIHEAPDKTNGSFGLTELATLLSTWVGILSFVAAGLKGLIPTIPINENAIAFLLGMGLIALFAAGILARRNLDAPTPQQIPFPATFWRLVFNRLPSPRGTSFGGQKVHVVVVFDPSVMKEAHAVKAHHRDPSLNVELAEINPVASDVDKTLRSHLTTADAVYFFWTPNVRANPSIASALNSWASDETEKPVLIVNTIPNEPYELKFNTVPSTEASDGLWRLLARANERSRQWVKQAATFRRWWLITIAFSLLIVVGLGVYARALGTSIGEREVREGIDVNSFSQTAEAVLAARKPLETVSDPSHVLISLLGRLCDFALADILRGVASPHAGATQMSVFRQDRSSPHGKLIQVGWSNGRTADSFAVDSNSIVGCSVVNHAFVLWRENCAPGSPAVWDVKGNVKGYCRPNNEIEIQNGVACKFMPLKVDQFQRKGLACFAPEIRDGNQTISDTAVCVDTELEPSFMTDAWFRRRIELFALTASSFPNTALPMAP
jgi:hypothetical protein